ncbi:uncharacterized protein FMAN_11840 [Fusarium mangiferae]|uniref:Uncharacterized protein n=1 Tax=Fusarium mangiferae TaxID=192010 RepID=A0A1L7UC30_FUSMA|nr:uncharacterized protein FMAN_11840 [Fusarium mangiferae]CVL06722.1 uncharacterized protein FMAN_11840 [Fusarium mangiferae]
MAASPITVAVVHTPYWNVSDAALLRDGSHNVVVPALLYLRASDIETTSSSPRPSHRPDERKRKRPHTSRRDSSLQFVHQFTSNSKQDHSGSSPCSVDSSDSTGDRDRGPANILHKLNVTEYERFLLQDLEEKIRQDAYHSSVQSTPSFAPASKRIRHDIDVSKAREQRSPEEEKDEYERWVMGSWDNLFSRASVYPE